MPTRDREHDDVEVLTPSRSTRVSASGHSHQCDSSGASATRAGASSWSTSGAAGKHGQVADPHQRVVLVVGPRRRCAWRPTVTASITGAVRGEVELVDAVEELEVARPRRRSASYSGAKTMSPMPAAIFQKIAPLYSKNIFVVRNTATPALTPRRARVRRRPSPKHEVVEPADEGEVGDLGRRAVPGDPVEEVLVVERRGSPRVR